MVTNPITSLLVMCYRVDGGSGTGTLWCRWVNRVARHRARSMMPPPSNIPSAS
jgi:hypothetical protein